VASSTYSVSGLASNMDTASIVDKLVELESTPLKLLKNKQSAMKSQVSLLGTIASKLDSLKTAIKGLSDDGVLAVTSASSAAGYGAVPGSDAAAGRYSIQTVALATAAKARSVAFTSSAAEVKAGSLSISVSGTAYDVSITQGMTLAQVAQAVSSSGAPVSASVISDGTSSYLSITNKDTGHTIGGDPATALMITENSTGVTGTALGASITAATNAKVKVDGLTIERRSNEITDAVPGTALTLKQVTATPEDLVLATDAAGTAEKLSTFVTAYNDVISTVQKQLAVSAGTDRESTLAGDSVLRTLQASLQRLLTNEASPTGAVRTLADLGVKTGRDGSLSVDSSVLNRAVSADPSAVNNLFANAATGLGTVSATMADRFLNSTDGLLTSRTKSLNKRVDQLDDDQVKLQLRIDGFRARLVAQFTAMETVISSLKATQQFLDQQNAAQES
jgi:flagellar hook-associated protein 2